MGEIRPDDEATLEEHDSTELDLERGTQFLSEDRVRAEVIALRDDLSVTQTRPRGTNLVTAQHFRNYLYDRPYHTDAPKYHETVYEPRNAPVKAEER